VHRLVLSAFENNYENKKYIDHINNKKSDNCLFNLRFVTNQENAFNSSISSRNTSGVKGITWHKKANKWQAQIILNRRCIHLGLYENIEDAKIARQNKAKELYGEFTNYCEKLNI
jgi:hypothetical protein